VSGSGPVIERQPGRIDRGSVLMRAKEVYTRTDGTCTRETLRMMRYQYVSTVCAILLSRLVTCSATITKSGKEDRIRGEKAP